MNSPTATDLPSLRKELHRLAELSGDEQYTALRIRQFLDAHSPDKIVDKIGGHGLAAVYEGKHPGKTILIRADLDALPIDESITIDHAAKHNGVSHKCGHDGHMTIVAGLAAKLAQNRPDKGRVVLLFQPAEETGEGAARVIKDKKFAAIQPDLVFALHNLPGYPSGAIVIRRGVFASASRGMIVELEGKTSHAGQPQEGNSPALAMAQLIEAFSASPQNCAALYEPAKVTVIHARLGEVAFGTSPGNAVIMATLRATTDDVINRISTYCSNLAKDIGKAHNLGTKVKWTQEFPSTTNHTEAVEVVEKAARAVDLEITYPDHPFPWSEDFGHFTAKYPGTLFGLGAGKRYPALHSPEYDFPDDLLEIGVRLLSRTLRGLCKE